MHRGALLGLIAISALGQAAAAKAPGSAPRAAISTIAPSHAPIASVKIFSPSPRTTWDGTGEAQSSVDLCIVSTTGRFRLQILSQSGGALTGPRRLHYTLSFRDGAGATHEVLVADQALITIEGSAPSAVNCDAGPNSVLLIKEPQAELLKGQAGEYFDRLRLAADPL